MLAPSMLQPICVFIAGAFLASFANYCIDRFDWFPRYRSPWRAFPKDLNVSKSDLPQRKWFDRIPIVGWLTTTRFISKKNKATVRESIPGWGSPLFWVRPFFVEILFPALLVVRFLYWRDEFLFDDAPYRALVCWFAETVLFWAALCASSIDLDDYVIPDAIVPPATIVALILAAAFPFLTFAPIDWPLDLSGEGSTRSVVGFVSSIFSTSDANGARSILAPALCAIWTFWAFALLDRRFYLRLGLKRAAAIFWRRLKRSALTPIVAICWLVGLVAIVAFVFSASTGASQASSVCDGLDSLSNAFVGLLVGMALIWGVRVIGGASLGVEAMGFGDVILSGMLGAFIGWRGAIVVFFVAPFFGLIFGLARRLVNTSREIPYGPFLCLATVLYVFKREWFDSILEPYFSDPLFVFGFGILVFALLAVLLFLLRLVRPRR